MTEDIKIIFFHIAKTGGTALLHHFRQNLGDDEIFVYGPNSRCMRFFRDQHQFEEMPKVERYKHSVIQGHGVAEQLLNLLDDSTYKLMVVLRDPVPLTRSRFNQRLIGMKRRGVFVDSETFMSDSASNIMYQRLLKAFPTFVDSDAVDETDKMISILSKFDYVYTTEQLEAQASAMMSVLNLPDRIEKRRVAGREKAVLSATDQQISAQNHVDRAAFELFNHVVESDGHTHNAVGFDRIGRTAALKTVSKRALVGDALRHFCYTELAKALSKDLKAEMALQKIDLAPSSVAIADVRLFKEILLSEWHEERKNYSAEANEISKEKAQNWGLRYRQRKRLSAKYDATRP